MPSDERIVPNTPKGGKPKQAPPRRRKSRSTLLAAATVVLLVVVIAVGFAVNGLPSKGSISESAQELSAEREAVIEENAAEIGEAQADGASQASDQAQDQATQDSAAAQGGQSAQGSQGQPAAPSGGSGSDAPTAVPDNSIRVHITVTADPGAAAKLSSYPQASMDVTLTDDQTPYGALAATGFAIGGSRTYVSSIGGLREKALGGTSGWMYLVNGAQVMKPAGSYQLSDGDEVYWHFVDTW